MAWRDSRSSSFRELAIEAAKPFRERLCLASISTSFCLGTGPANNPQPKQPELGSQLPRVTTPRCSPNAYTRPRQPVAETPRGRRPCHDYRPCKGRAHQSLLCFPYAAPLPVGARHRRNAAQRLTAAHLASRRPRSAVSDRVGGTAPGRSNQKSRCNHGPGKAASARCSNSFSWCRKKKVPTATRPIAASSNSKLTGPATRFISAPNR